MTGIHHVGLTVRDLDRSATFYAAVVGARELHPIEPGDDPRVPTMVGVPGAAISGRMLRVGADHLLELLRYASDHARRLDVRPCDSPSAHLAFTVADLGTALELVDGHGGRRVGDPVEFDAGYFGYCADPDGNLIELIQPR